MKVSMVAISCLLLLIITIAPGSKTQISLEEHLEGGNQDARVFSSGPYHPTECCLIYTSRIIPRQRIAYYYETSSQCSKPGVIFITKKGRLVCANPGDNWVQDYIRKLK